jgi:imidazolonepropionase-like amidohydrolase
VLFLMALASCRASPRPPPGIAVVDVTVIDVRDGSLTPNVTVLAGGGRITAVGPSDSTRLPERAREIDGRGKFLIPGLWDMHVDTDGDLTVLNTMLSTGVTGVLDVGSDIARIADAQRQIDARLIAGPRVFIAGAAPTRDMWLVPMVHSFYFSAPAQWESIRSGFRDRVPRIRRDHVSILAGSGWNTALEQRGAPNGWSLHAELAALVDAGFTALEALRAATLNPAVYLGLSDSLGAVDVGKTADLLLLEANPLVDIRNTRRVAAVVSRGTPVAER